LVAFVNDTITFYANASSDNPSATLTFTIFYDYYMNPFPTLNPESPVTVNTTGSPGSVVRTYAYNHPGNISYVSGPIFWVQLYVDDGASNVSTDIQVTVNPPPVNEPPVFIWRPVDPIGSDPGVSVYIPIKIADNNSDTISVIWDFGDGTNATNTTVAPPFPPGVLLSQIHTWNPRIPGVGGYVKNYTLNVSLSDGLNPPVNSSTTITINVPSNSPPNILGDEVKASKVSASSLEPIGFSIGAYDPEGDPLTWTFNYTDGSLEVFHTGFTTPGLRLWQNTTHSFATNGNYTVSVSVSDALPGAQTGDHNRTVQSSTIRIVTNVPPTAFAINVEPSSPLINTTLGYVNVTLSVDAWDLDGDMFNLTWDMGIFGIRTNSSVGDAAQRKQPYTFRQVVQFNNTGSYPIVVTVTDGRPGHEVRLTKLANVSSKNYPPSVLSFNHEPYSLGDFAAANETVKFRLVVTDRERDALELIWDFGDGSAKQFMNRTDYDANGNITVLVNHTYVLKGHYNMTLIVTDNKIGSFNHTITSVMPIQVSVRSPEVVTNWDWWDYTSIALFMMIPIGFIAWAVMLRRQRKHIEDQGMSLDEWKIMKEIDLKELGK
jgi:hypothetical protein